MDSQTDKGSKRKLSTESHNGDKENLSSLSSSDNSMSPTTNKKIKHVDTPRPRTSDRRRPKAPNVSSQLGIGMFFKSSNKPPLPAYLTDANKECSGDDTASSIDLTGAIPDKLLSATSPSQRMKRDSLKPTSSDGEPSSPPAKQQKINIAKTDDTKITAETSLTISSGEDDSTKLLAPPKKKPRVSKAKAKSDLKNNCIPVNVNTNSANLIDLQSSETNNENTFKNSTKSPTQADKTICKDAFSLCESKSISAINSDVNSNVVSYIDMPINDTDNLKLTSPDKLTTTKESNPSPIKETNLPLTEESRTPPTKESKYTPTMESYPCPIEESNSSPIEESKTPPTKESETSPTKDSKISPAKNPSLTVECASPIVDSKSKTKDQSKITPSRRRSTKAVSEAKRIETEAKKLAKEKEKALRDQLKEQKKKLWEEELERRRIAKEMADALKLKNIEIRMKQAEEKSQRNKELHEKKLEKLKELELKKSQGNSAKKRAETTKLDKEEPSKEKQKLSNFFKTSTSSRELFKHDTRVKFQKLQLKPFMTMSPMHRIQTLNNDQLSNLDKQLKQQEYYSSYLQNSRNTRLFSRKKLRDTSKQQTMKFEDDDVIIIENEDSSANLKNKIESEKIMQNSQFDPTKSKKETALLNGNDELNDDSLKKKKVPTATLR